MSNEKELIWVTKEQAEIFKELDSNDNQRNFVDKLIKERKLDIENSIESLDDDLLRLKSFTLTYKTELRKVYDEQDKALEELQEKHDDKIYELKNKITQLKPELEKVVKEIKEVTKVLDGISTYSMDRLIEMVNKVNYMNEKDKKLLMDLIELSGKQMDYKINIL